MKPDRRHSALPAAPGLRSSRRLPIRALSPIAVISALVGASAYVTINLVRLHFPASAYS